jgi:hypothetical protein
MSYLWPIIDPEDDDEDDDNPRNILSKLSHMKNKTAKNSFTKNLMSGLGIKPIKAIKGMSSSPKKKSGSK